MKENDFKPIYTISGKTLVITDLHIGLKKASQSKLSIIVSVFKNFLRTIKEEKVSNVICCGDIFHSRTALDLQALNVGLKLISALAERCNCYLILGNHDLYYKNTTNINSSNAFKYMKNVHIIDEAIDVEINGKKALFVPWLGDLSNKKKSFYDLAFGHFDVNGEYLIASYIEEHADSGQKQIEETIREMLEKESLLAETTNCIDIQKEFLSLKGSKTKSNDLVGNFIDYVKPYGTIYAGHIHEHKEFVSKMRQFIFVGSPYQQNFGEIDSESGYYLLDENNVPKFIRTTNVPKHIRLKISEILAAGIDSFDFSSVKGNIVQKVYDIEIDLKTEAQINQKISDYLPFEEVLPDYIVGLSSDNTVITNESLETIKKSKLEYIRNYLDSIDEKVLNDSNIDKNKLYSMLEYYFNLAMEKN